MKIIFLDFDGVLNCPEDWIEMKEFGHPCNKGTDVISRQKLALLKRLIEETGAKIVVSSTWRKHYSIRELRNMFVERGWEIPISTFYGMTNPDSSYRKRGDDVDEFLKDHPEVSRYVILDDQPVFHVYQKEFFVHCNQMHGMSYEDMRDAIEILNEKPYTDIILL